MNGPKEIARPGFVTASILPPGNGENNDPARWDSALWGGGARWGAPALPAGGDQASTPIVLRAAGAAHGGADIVIAVGHVDGQTLEIQGHAPNVKVEPIRAAVRIARAPGARLQHALEFLLPRDSFQAIVAPVIADTHCEYFESLAKGRTAHARWVSIRLFLIIWLNVAAALLSPFVQLVRKLRGGG